MPKPTYPLADVQARIRQLGAAAFASSALDTAREELEMTVDQAIEFICGRTDRECFKTMPSRQCEAPGAMQDVYRWLCPNGVQVAYVKLSLARGSKVVISLKEM